MPRTKPLLHHRGRQGYRRGRPHLRREYITSSFRTRFSAELVARRGRHQMGPEADLVCTPLLAPPLSIVRQRESPELPDVCYSALRATRADHSPILDFATQTPTKKSGACSSRLLSPSRAGQIGDPPDRRQANADRATPLFILLALCAVFVSIRCRKGIRCRPQVSLQTSELGS